MITMAEFYENIPSKECFTCGDEMHEQHESYAIECERCMNIREE